MDASLEIVDLGDAISETRQLFLWPLFFDSIFLMGEPD
jgi:hypothetical protein